MIHHKPLFFVLFSFALIDAYVLNLPETIAYEAPQVTDARQYQGASQTELLTTLNNLQHKAEQLLNEIKNKKKSTGAMTVIPFYSQFNDITDPSWKKIGCGIASLAMIIDYYGEAESVDSLLQKGIVNGAYISSAGWSHAGLIALAKSHGLDGQTVGLYELSMDTAFSKLKEAVTEGPVMVSVHYTFEPTNPIPHLAVITGVTDDTVYYNDPAEPTGGGSISAEKFKSAWKKRYIEIRPTT